MPSPLFMSMGPYIKRGDLLTLEEKSMKSRQEILKLLGTLWAPKWVAAIHCRGHQKGDATIAQGNWKADREAKQMALVRGPVLTVLMAALFPCPLAEWFPWLTPQEQAWFKTEEGNLPPDGWWKFATAALPYLSHWLLHLSSSSMKELIQGEQPSRPP
jgi:hypothetical protein